MAIPTSHLSGAASMPQILVVDDEQDACSLLQRILSIRGYDVIAFTEVSKALAWLENHVPQLALVDIKMPELDGIRLLRRIRVQHPNIQVIMITGYPSAETANEARQLGIADYLVKPVEIDELEACIQRVLESIS
jgi:DNA-binding NtrC family response regulator